MIDTELGALPPCLLGVVNVLGRGGSSTLPLAGDRGTDGVGDSEAAKLMGAFWPPSLHAGVLYAAAKGEARPAARDCLRVPWPPPAVLPCADDAPCTVGSLPGPCLGASPTITRLSLDGSGGECEGCVPASDHGRRGGGGRRRREERLRITAPGSGACTGSAATVLVGLLTCWSATAGDRAGWESSASVGPHGAVSDFINGPLSKCMRGRGDTRPLPRRLRRDRGSGEVSVMSTAALVPLRVGDTSVAEQSKGSHLLLLNMGDTAGGGAAGGKGPCALFKGVEG